MIFATYSAAFLAGDIDDPGSISRRTVSVAEDLSSLDLQEFLKTQVSYLGWRRTGCPLHRAGVGRADRSIRDPISVV